LEDEYLSVPFERWQQQLRDYIAKVPLQDILLTEVSLREMKTREDIRYEYAFLRLAEARVLHSVGQKKFETKHTCLADFARLGSAFAERYYTREARQEWRELLPEDLQAALLLREAFALEDSDVKQAASLERQAAEMYPPLRDVVLSYQKAFQQEIALRKQRAGEELRALEKQVKAQVMQCIAEKRYEEALEILAQLKQLKPADLEVAELSLRVRLKQLEEERADGK
jgi:hypothetical protein